MIYRESCKTYGSPSIWDALVKQEHRIGEHRLARLMCQDGIRAKTVKMRRAPNQSQHRFLVAENTLDRPVRIESQIGCGQEISPTSDLPRVVLDLYSRRVIGWAMGHHLTVDLAEQALTMALSHRPPTDGLLHHSDRGSHYAATSYQRLLNAHGINASMSRTGNCWVMPAWRASSSHSSVDSSIIANTAHGTRRDRTSLSTSKRSLIGYVGTPHSATTPRPSSKRDRL